MLYAGRRVSRRFQQAWPLVLLPQWLRRRTQRPRGWSSSRAPWGARLQGPLSQLWSTSARAQLPFFVALLGPDQGGQSHRGFSPLTRPLEADQGCARTVARAARLVSRTASLRARREAVAGGMHRVASVAGGRSTHRGSRGRAPWRGFGGGAPIAMPAKPHRDTMFRSVRLPLVPRHPRLLSCRSKLLIPPCPWSRNWGPLHRHLRLRRRSGSCSAVRRATASTPGCT